MEFFDIKTPKEIDIEIWERTFHLDITSNFYQSEELSPKQAEAVNHFLSNLKWIEKSKKNVESYCKLDVENDDENNKKDNIFSYVQPKCIFVEDNVKIPRVAILFHYRYDAEHGLAVVFDKDGNVTVGIQDIII